MEFVKFTERKKIGVKICSPLKERGGMELWVTGFYKGERLGLRNLKGERDGH